MVPNGKIFTVSVLALVVCIEVTLCQSQLVEVFRDDFNGSTLNTTKWNAFTGFSQVNSELEYYSADAVTVKDGYLDIRSSIQQNGDRNYTSGRVDTQNKYTFQYGEIEWHAKVPKGKGIWTALWLSDPHCAPAVPCPDYWPPAVSIIDMRGDYPNKVTSTVFYRGNGGASSAANSILTTTPDLSLDFHIFRLNWQKDSMVFHVDDREILLVNDTTKIPHQRMQIVMNVAVGGNFPNGPPDATTVFPTDFLIDYVVVRQAKDMVNYNSSSSPAAAAGGRVPTYVGPLVGSLLGVLLLLVLVGVGWVYAKRRRFNMGNMRRDSSFDSLDTNSTMSSLLYMRTGNASFDLLLKRYVNLIEIPADHLQLGDRVLGKGEFGIVYQGVAQGLRGQPKPATVAVKMLISQHLDAEEQRQIGEEIRVMTKLGRHLNVVNLLGIVVKGNPLLVLEYCQFGCLLTFLKMHRGAYFYNHVDREGNLLPFDLMEEKHVEADARQISGRRASFPEDNFDGLVMSSRDLVSFAYQISRGMEYLVSRNVIHRDLAARNVLVAEKKIVKISDFGMARQRQSVYVLENNQASLPVKWMPPEAIVSKTFSQKSDVWSYGILLSEIFTLGDMPYTGSKVSNSLNEFVAWLAEGHQMPRPAAAPVEVYALQKLCWKLHTEDRPTFSELREELDKLISVDLSESYLAMDEPYQRFNKLNEELLAKMDEVEQAEVEEDTKKVPEPDSDFSHGNNYMETFLGP